MARNEPFRLHRLSHGSRQQKMACEHSLACALREVLAELVFTDAGLLMAYINAGKISIIEDLVASAAERSLKPGLLRYGGHASIDADWGAPPTVAMAMEINHPALSVFFRIVFDAKAVGVEMDSILFHTHEAGDDDVLAHLRTMLDDAKLPAP